MGAKGSIVENYMNNRFEAETMICKNTCIKITQRIFSSFVAVSLQGSEEASNIIE